jgi:AcrR family transcriptional regulator
MPQSIEKIMSEIVEKSGAQTYTESQLERAITSIVEYGGVVKLLEEISDGMRETEIARRAGISIPALNSYLKSFADSSDIEAARAAGYQSRFEALASSAALIDSDKKRFDAQFDLEKYLADKHTLKYREKIKDNSGTGITISVDWNSFSQAPPRGTVIDLPFVEVNDGKDMEA